MNNEAATQASQPQGFIADAKAYLNEDKGVLTHVLTDDIRIVMPINLYKKILGIPFEKSANSEPQNQTKLNTYGLLARPRVYLSKDGRFLIHSVLGIRVSKHVNYYKKILGASFESDSRQEKSA